MFADDNNLFASGPLCKINEIIQQIKEDIMRCESWMSNNSVSLNIDKTQLLIIGRPFNLAKLRNTEIFINGKSITRISSIWIILGEVFDETMSWTQKVIKSCNSALYSILPFKKTLTANSRKIFVNALTISHIHYGSIVWLKPYCANYSNIYTMLHKYARFVANLCKYDSVSDFINNK